MALTDVFNSAGDWLPEVANLGFPQPSAPVVPQPSGLLGGIGNIFGGIGNIFGGGNAAAPSAAPAAQAPQMSWGQRWMNSPLTHLGMGLLSGNTFGEGLSRGFGSYAQSQVQAQQQAFQQWRIQQQMEEARREEERRLAMMQALNNPALQSRIDPALAPLLPYLNPSLSDLMKLTGSDEDMPTSVQEAQWLMTASPEQRAAYMQNKRAGATNVSVSMGEKMAPMSDLGQFVDAQGNAPPVGSTYNDLRQGVDSGRYKQLTPSDVAQRDVRAKSEAMQAELDEEVAEAQQRVDEARAEFNADPLNPRKKRAVDDAVYGLGLARAGEKNWRGEASEGVLKNQPQEPGAIRGLLESYIWGKEPTQQNMQMVPTPLPPGFVPGRAK